MQRETTRKERTESGSFLFSYEGASSVRWPSGERQGADSGRGWRIFEKASGRVEGFSSWGQTGGGESETTRNMLESRNPKMGHLREDRDCIPADIGAENMDGTCRTGPADRRQHFNGGAKFSGRGG